MLQITREKTEIRSAPSRNEFSTIPSGEEKEASRSATRSHRLEIVHEVFIYAKGNYERGGPTSLERKCEAVDAQRKWDKKPRDRFSSSSGP